MRQFNGLWLIPTRMPTTIKAALKRWEEATGKKAGEAKEIKLIGVYPPIEKMEGPFHLLINCEKFSLSTNLITRWINLLIERYWNGSNKLRYVSLSLYFGSFDCMAFLANCGKLQLGLNAHFGHQFLRVNISNKSPDIRNA